MSKISKSIPVIILLALLLAFTPVSARADDEGDLSAIQPTVEAVEDSAQPEAEAGESEGPLASDEDPVIAAEDDPEVVGANGETTDNLTDEPVTETTEPGDESDEPVTETTEPGDETDPDVGGDGEQPGEEVPASEIETGWVVEEGVISYVDPETGEKATGETEISGLCAPVTAAGSELTDVDETTPHGEDVQWLFETGISTGWATGEGEAEFRPTNTIIRQDMAAFLYRLAGSPTYEPSDDDVAAFTDVTAATPHALEIWWLASTGVSEGWLEADGTRTFRPTNAVVRQDMAAFLYRLAGSPELAEAAEDELENGEGEVLGEAEVASDVEGVDEGVFTDVSEQTPHHDEVLWLASTGVSEGWLEADGTCTFRPTNGVVRQDMAAFLHRMIENGVFEPDASHEYLFDESGSLLTGWVEVEGESRFYDTTNGTRVESGWVRDGSDKSYIDPTTKELLSGGLHEVWGSEFLFDDEGNVVYGWADTELGLRFFDRSSGAMLVSGIRWADDSRYLFADDGALQYGWQKVEESTYYFDLDTGAMLHGGIFDIDGSSYYFKGSGAMALGWATVSGSRYYFDPTSGAMWKGGLYTINGSTYLLGDNGAAFKGWTTINGAKRYFDPKTYAMCKSRACTIGGDTYYFNASGSLVSGWVTYGGAKHYFDKSSYKMLKSGIYVIGNAAYRLGRDGAVSSLTGTGSSYADSYASSHLVSMYPADSSGVRLVCALSSYGQSLSSASAEQIALVTCAWTEPTTRLGWCAAWVHNVFISYSGRNNVNGNACDLYYRYCTSSNPADLKVGMIIAVSSHPNNSAGRIYGHIGLYVGDGVMLDSSGCVRTFAVEDWVDYYGGLVTPKWGWYGDIDLS